MLLNAVEPDVIMYLIRCVDMYRDPSSLEVLVDILLLKNGSYPDESVKEKFVNVRVMCAKAIANQKILMLFRLFYIVLIIKTNTIKCGWLVLIHLAGLVTGLRLHH